MILTHKPVPHNISQTFANNATAGVVGDWNGTETQKLVAQFGNYQPGGHLAVDFACPTGTPIVAAAPGAVAYAGPGQNMPAAICAKYGYIQGSPDSGNITVIDHGDNTATAYSHQSEVQVKAGQWVNGGQQIGLSGKTGRITGPHLHFEYMTLPINYSSIRYSRLDPLAQYGGGGIKTVGNTTQEEDDMASPEVMQLLQDIAARISVTNETAKDAAARVSVVNDNLKVATKSIRDDIGTVHTTIIRDVGSQLGNIQKGVTQKVDVDSLAMELAGNLEQRDLQALAEKLTITVKGK